MDKLYTIIGVATFWSFIIIAIYGAIHLLIDEIKTCLELRKIIKYETNTGTYYKTLNGKSWYHNTDIKLLPTEPYTVIKWNQFYDLDWWTKLWLIGLK